MGGGSYSSKDWTYFSSSRAYSDPKTTTKDIFKSGGLSPDLDPKEFKIRESVDSISNPQSTPIIIGLDVTGSMNPVLDDIARNGLKTLCEGIYERRPITDPHICILGIGDVICDRAPFQATQFEADIRIFEHLEKLYLENGGGGNSFESYILAWYFARYRTKTDSFSKRGVKGFIFTLGDECITPKISAGDFKRHLADDNARSFTSEDLFAMVSPEWNVFHLIIKQGNYASHAFSEVKKSWEEVIGSQRVLPVGDHTKIGEIILSVLDLFSGKSSKEVVASWNGSTSVVVGDALKSIGAVSIGKALSVEEYL
jgi:hypothetical protein